MVRFLFLSLIPNGCVAIRSHRKRATWFRPAHRRRFPVRCCCLPRILFHAYGDQVQLRCFVSHSLFFMVFLLCVVAFIPCPFRVGATPLRRARACRAAPPPRTGIFRRCLSFVPFGGSAAAPLRRASLPLREAAPRSICRICRGVYANPSFFQICEQVVRRPAGSGGCVRCGRCLCPGHAVKSVRVCQSPFVLLIPRLRRGSVPALRTGCWCRLRLS